MHVNATIFTEQLDQYIGSVKEPMSITGVMMIQMKEAMQKNRQGGCKCLDQSMQQPGVDWNWDADPEDDSYS